jgi:hypothetical protein
LNWPAVIRPLVEEYGEEAVREVGILALSYPPEWVHTFKEVAAVAAEIRNRKGSET